MSSVLFCVDDDPNALAALERDLRRRYGSDYEVIAETSATRCLERLTELSEGGIEVALVLADQWMPEMTGIELLERTRALHPFVKRVLIIDVGDVGAEPHIARALTLNQLDFYVGKPWESPEEELYPITGEGLRLWAHGRLPRYEKAKIVGDPASPRARDIKAFLDRNSVACGLFAPDSDEGSELSRRHGIDAATLPALVLFDGRVLLDPSNIDIAGGLGAKTSPDEGRYDVTILGSGPAGLAAAVYAASEGLSTVVLEPSAIGGQAGTSSRIRNYLGFPWGVTGKELAERASRQAQQFGASFVITPTATGLHAEGRERIVTLSSGDQIRTQTVVIATGVSYRRLKVPGIEPLVGAGVFYGGVDVEARVMKGFDAFVVGGGNSAGQAAAALAAAGADVTLVIRGDSFAGSMSAYLIEQLDNAPNVKVLLRTGIAEVRGEQRLETIVLQDLENGTTRPVDADALFIFVGGEPRTEWLPHSVARDVWGYVVTGRDLTEDRDLLGRWPLTRSPSLLETSMPGVFAAGDVRHRSIKRVAAAVGEGSTAILLVHEYLDHL